MEPRRRIILALFGLALFGLGCATWQPIQREKIATTLRDTKPDYARVGAASTVLIVRHPEVRADTLRGTIREGNDVRVAIPLTMVDSLSLYRNDRLAHAAPLLGVGFAFLFLTGLLLVHQQPAF